MYLTGAGSARHRTWSIGLRNLRAARQSASLGSCRTLVFSAYPTHSVWLFLLGECVFSAWQCAFLARNKCGYRKPDGGRLARSCYSGRLCAGTIEASVSRARSAHLVDSAGIPKPANLRQYRADVLFSAIEWHDYRRGSGACDPRSRLCGMDCNCCLLSD